MLENLTVDRKAQQIIVQRLWPTMLFLVIMTIVSGCMGYWWTGRFTNEIHGIVGFYIWLLACILILIYGCVALYKDTQIQTAKPKKEKAIKKQRVAKKAGETHSG